MTTAARVDRFIANSAFVAQRIESTTGMTTTVIHLPDGLGRFAIGTPGETYLCARQITPYKKIELAVEACTRTGRSLW